MSNKPFWVHVGFTPAGNDRWNKYGTLEEANSVCDEVFKKTGIVLTVVKKG